QRAGKLADEAKAALTPACLGVDSKRSSFFGHLAVAWAPVDPRKAAEAAEDAIRIHLKVERDNSGLEALVGILAGALAKLSEHIACDLIDSDHHRARMVRELGGDHPWLAARILATHPTAEHVLTTASTDPEAAADLARAMSGE